VTSACAALRERLPQYAGDTLSLEQRRAVREHLASCRGCRAEAAALDPAMLFAALPEPPAAPEDVAAVLAGVRAGISLKRAERRVRAAAARPTPAGSGPRAGRVAAAVIVALLVVGIPMRLRGPEAPPRPVASRNEPAPAGRVSETSVPRASGKATVYDLGTGAGEPRVVWIVDGSLDL
jgi:anti-sigma factor RsiW